MATNVEDVAINPTIDESPAVDTDLAPDEAGQLSDVAVGEADSQGAAEPSSQEPQPQQATPPTDGAPEWWKPDLFKLKYRGSEVSPKDYQHAVNLMQKGWSYEQAMAEVKSGREELEGLRQKYGSYEKLDEAFRKNPAFAQRIQQMYLEAQQQRQGQPQYPAQQYHNQQLAPELTQKIEEFEQFKTQWQNEQADNTIRGEIDTLKGRYPGENWDGMTETGFTFLRDVLKHAHDNRFPTIEAAYRDYTFDRVANNAKMQGAEYAAQQRQRQVQRGVVSTGSQKPANAPPPIDVSNMSYDEITANIKKQAGVG